MTDADKSDTMSCISTILSASVLSIISSYYVIYLFEFFFREIQIMSGSYVIC